MQHPPAAADLCRHIRPPPSILNGDDEQLRVWAETVYLVVFALRFPQGLQVRRRFPKAFSTDTTPKGEQRIDERLLGLPRFRVVFPNYLGHAGLCTFPVYTSLSPHTFSLSQLPRSTPVFLFLFHQLWERSDKIRQEEPDAQARNETAVGTFGG